MVSLIQGGLMSRTKTINIEKIRKAVHETNEQDSIQDWDIDFLTITTAILFLEKLGFKIKGDE